MVASRRAPPLALGAALLVVLATIWAGGFALQLSGWRDVDGWVDCNRFCHGWHYVGALLFWAPPLTAAAVLVTVLGVLAARLRRRLSRGRAVSEARGRP